ncbi:hypothetical protein E6P09_07105 [Haloferax mediterranei ATCC 33500]|uniref:DUF7319 domain-containing protein n=1 Tax=Haloferax mediterranei (strain ATCC 33500 / DSM 1411 / JCM 8866 / NBRC 14739 / NCIMB 2177 / R-4) TaxID=523841 RepID=I3R2S7_HALMT|nr:hypothetical protein [Haloferax mediterranei]AFK18537.1 hypothetical protein HFX_0815 [Haloferax mediterranei ATCC 33500]AHZ22083.1 hypothetical protein BM92_05160 [Haloferax mediterranei ATCC 33500]EMA02189.1 hypothetical protein C439_06400 [Haloferax mediterranei ATCC 33500]MDX5988627.1 hypothetical protein [Haloferax mediterranei ATCC 33500]QCQ75042.1 hypothetical protein E6P09_07105 [Haloferax mediterranei ATCC 33500]
MPDSSSAPADDTPSPDADADAAVSEDELETLRQEVESKYDFDNFGPADMAKMTAEEWEAAFDPDSWIVGEELLERVEQELRYRIAIREIFAILERVTENGKQRILAYSDEGYAVVYPDGSVEGEGTVLRDVKPTVALCSMDDFDVNDAPSTVRLPGPDEVAQGTGDFGNLMLQIVAFGQVIGGIALIASWPLLPKPKTIIAPVAGLGFLVIGIFLFVVVANARLSDRFRAEEYRDRLREIGVEDGTRPEFVPTFDGDGTTTPLVEGPDGEPLSSEG